MKDDRYSSDISVAQTTNGELEYQKKIFLEKIVEIQRKQKSNGLPAQLRKIQPK